MNVFSHTETSRREVALPAAKSSRVCMHVQGIARNDARVMREAGALVETGFTVAVVDIEGEAGRPITENIQGIHLEHVLMHNWYISTQFPWSLIKAAQMFIRTTLRLLRTPTDVYHAHDVPALPACYIAARLRRKPLIFDAHELPLSEMPLSKMSTSRRFIHPLLTRLFVSMIPYCTGAIATSSPMAYEIAERYHYSKVSVVRNFPLHRTITKSERLRQYLGLGPGVRIALYQGNIQPDRELDRLVRAAVFLEQNIVIVMMGKAEETTLSELKALIASEEVTDRVRIIPPVPYEELLDWTASADIGLSILPLNYTPHLNVCLPNKLFEYLMVGLPILASPLGAITEVIKTCDVGQVLPSLAPVDVGAAINAILADRAALESMRRNALEVAQHEFCWEKERVQLIHLYHRVLGSSGAKDGMWRASVDSELPA
jgi:glycosyltransferase involved in cell wall biosynthesis